MNRYMFTHFFHFNVHLARDFQIKNFMQFGALLVASSDRNLRDFERFSGLGQLAQVPYNSTTSGQLKIIYCVYCNVCNLRSATHTVP